MSNTRSLLLLTVLASLASAVNGNGLCCATSDCVIGGGCYGKDGLPGWHPDVQPRPEEECLEDGYPYFRKETGTGDDGFMCLPTSDNPMPFGDCYSDSECDDLAAFGVPLQHCVDNGYGYFVDIYDDLNNNNGVQRCRSVASLISQDPHIKLWNGTYFDYMGECDLVMVSAPEFEPNTPLGIHVRTRIRRDYSFIESAALKIGQDVLEVASFGEYALNEVDSADLHGALVGGFPVYHSTKNMGTQHVFDVVIGTHENITLSHFKDMVSVQITEGTNTHFQGTRGLMGNFAGQMMARDGTTILSDINAFGQEWQVQEDEPKLFRTVRAPQHPQEQCRLPTVAEKARRKLRMDDSTINKEAASEACAYLKAPERIEACIFDVLATRDLDVARAGAY